MKYFQSAFVLFLTVVCAAAEVDFQTFNRQLGLPLLADDNLWDDPSSPVLARLAGPNGKIDFTDFPNGKIGTITPDKSSFFGIPVEQFRLFLLPDGKLSGVDILLTNKGDSIVDGRTTKFARELRQDIREVETRLTQLLGSGESAFHGSGRTTTKLKVWYWKKLAVLPEGVRREYLVIHLIPREKVNSRRRNRTEALDTAELNLTGNLEKNARGDVYIKNIPMVAQGSKGYCVPATLERCFLYYGITGIDMHRIADWSETDATDGTKLAKALSGVRPVLKEYGLNMEELGGTSMRHIVRAINCGYPIVLTLYSTDDYVERMLDNTTRRELVPLKEWKKTLRRQKRLPSRRKGAHVCLIIGYNEETGELAVSNSWGEQYLLHWVRLEDVKAVMQDVPLYAMEPR